MNFDKARHNMVKQQVRSWDVIDKQVLSRMQTIQREEFVQVSQRKLAFADMSLPIGHQQSMMKPVVEGRMLQSLKLDSSMDVLEVGTGSAYVTAVLASMCHQVTSIDHETDFIHSAENKLKEQGIHNVTLIHEDFFNFKNQQKFDRIVITGGLSKLPAFVFNWLNPEGQIFAIIGQEPIMEARIYQADQTYSSQFDTCVNPLTDKTHQQTFEL